MTAPALPTTQLAGRILRAVGWAVLSGALGTQIAYLLADLLPDGAMSGNQFAAFAFLVFAGLRLVAEGNALDPARHRRSSEPSEKSTEPSDAANTTASTTAATTAATTGTFAG